LAQRWRSITGDASLEYMVIIIGFGIKARREEAMLTGQFGAAFDEHRRYTGFLLPKLRHN
jgi:protein-S-isoprenylcysteine O-methyltransferase Ste14